METGRLEQLIEENYQNIFLLSLKMLKNREDAEDATQDIFLKVYENISSFRHEAKFTTWIYRIALNHIYYMNTQRLKMYNNQPNKHEIRTEHNEDPADVLVEKELFNALEKIIDGLSPKQKEVFIMRYYNQLPFKDIAKILKKSLGTVKSNYFFAMQKIKNELEQNQLLEFQE
ncbi:MAG TPA: RNA polymerase sigma factor [Candidatus Cloacimonetes bacterium]|nr:RNA polymerase sigma factor [Candidatus Cloacimonadota bacterium]HEX37252.1 RNA polymerase sigma factor [Candidatus Cloacimonadota bacterium]